MMNASDERGIDVIRGKIKDATRYAPMNGNFKIIFLDEADEMCLVEGTKVLIGWNTNKKIVRIEDIPKDHYISIMSLNIETQKVEKDKGICIDTGVSDVYKILLEDGRTIECTDRHPFFVFDRDGNIIEKKLYELGKNDEIVDFSDEVVKKCEICGEYTTNERFCSVECKDKGHSIDMAGEGNSMYGKRAWNKGLKASEDSRINIEPAIKAATADSVKRKRIESLKKFYLTEKGREAREETNKKISELKKGKTLEEMYSDPEERRRQSSITYKKYGIFLDSNYRRYLPDADYVECEICSKMIKNGGQDGIYVHHIDGNHNNNSKENLMFVCPRCHNMICHDCRDKFLQKGWNITHQKRMIQ